MIKGIIVDDEELGRTNLKNLIKNYCTQIEIVGMAAGMSKAKELVTITNPDVIFLDINMPGGNGFDLVAQLHPDHTPHIVFVTAYDHYAIQAIKANAFDYILKPIDIDELLSCEQKLLKLSARQKTSIANDIEAVEEKISIKHNKGVKLINIKDIIYLEAEGAYTIIHFYDDAATEKFTASRTLGDFEQILGNDNFFRVHKSYLINVLHTKEYNINENVVIMSNKMRIEVSRRRSVLFKQFLDGHYNRFR